MADVEKTERARPARSATGSTSTSTSHTTRSKAASRPRLPPEAAWSVLRTRPGGGLLPTRKATKSIWLSGWPI